MDRACHPRSKQPSIMSWRGVYFLIWSPGHLRNFFQNLLTPLGSLKEGARTKMQHWPSTVDGLKKHLLSFACCHLFLEFQHHVQVHEDSPKFTTFIGPYSICRMVGMTKTHPFQLRRGQTTNLGEKRTCGTLAKRAVFFDAFDTLERCLGLSKQQGPDT